MRKKRESISGGQRPLTNSFANDKWLLQEDTLKKWSHLTLLQRVAKIEKLFRVKVSHDTLHRFYKQHKIIYRKTHMGFRRELTDPALFQKRHDFALQLSKYEKAQTPIIYADETTFNCWMRKAHAWYKAATPFRVHYSAKRGSGITLYAAIGTHLDRMVTHTADATSIEGYGDFAERLVAALPPRLPYEKKPVLVVDNARPHHNKRILAFLKKHVRVLFTPVSSCQFNSIETAFAIIKRKYLKRITKLALRRDYGEQDAHTCI